MEYVFVVLNEGDEAIQQQLQVQLGMVASDVIMAEEKNYFFVLMNEEARWVDDIVNM